MIERVLVTGGSGFVGKHLVRALVSAQCEVDCLIHNEANLGDLPVVKTKAPVYGQYDIIYHIAGALGKKGLPLRAYWEPAVELTKTIVSSMRPSQRLVFMSSQYITLPRISHYEGAKVLGELVVTKNLPQECYRIVRPGFIYGEGDFHHRPLFDMVKVMGIFFPIVGNGRNTVFPTYIDDVIVALTKAFSFQENIIPVAGDSITMNDFIEAISLAMDAGRPRLHVPAIRVEPIKSWMRTDFFTCEQKFTSVIKPTSLEVGLKKCAEWYLGYPQ